MEGPERVVCCTLCMCMAVAVFSSVALVYLTRIVYVPAKREIQSGLSHVPAMCTTIERLETDECDWISCYEWCLSKSNHCVKLWAQVRKNGTDIVLDQCTNIQDITYKVLDTDLVQEEECNDNWYEKVSEKQDCQSVNDRFYEKCPYYNNCGNGGGNRRMFKCSTKHKKCISKRQHIDCKQDGQNPCRDLNHLFLCKDGLCQNITSAFDCKYEQFESSTEQTNKEDCVRCDCNEKRNCITLNGLYDCKSGFCSKVAWPWNCERRCESLEIGPSKNVILLAGDRMLSADCKSIFVSHSQASIWEKRNGDSKRIVMASCTEINSTALDKRNPEVPIQIIAKDCVNGTLMPKEKFSSRIETNYTEVNRVFQEQGYRHKLDTDEQKIPYDTDIIIYDKTKVLINTESCVNTLQYECTTFYLDHGRDGRNHSAKDRFPCYYSPFHQDFVTTRFSLEDTKYLLVLCFSIPASLWIFSCSCLFGCSKTLRVEESGQMRIRCRRQVDDLESPYRRASDSSKDFSGNNIGQKFKYKKNGEKIS